MASDTSTEMPKWSILEAALMSNRTAVKCASDSKGDLSNLINHNSLASSSAQFPSQIATMSSNVTQPSVFDSIKEEFAVPHPAEDIFSVDRRRIETVGEANQADELRSLGLHVYDQATLEKSILDQVDEALVEQDRRKLNSDITSVRDDIASCTLLLKQSESLVKRTNVKETMSINNDISKRHKQLATLKARERCLIEKKDQLHRTTSVPSDKLAAASNPGHSRQVRQKEESERERKIRLGEMTPFGTTMDRARKTPAPLGMSELERYLESQAQLQKNKKKATKRKIAVEKVTEGEERASSPKAKLQKKKQTSPLKMSILKPKKRRPKEGVGSSTSTNSWRLKPQGALLSERTELEASGSEYHPSESEEDEDHSVLPGKSSARAKPKPKATVKDVEPWGTDDSDWESSDEEGELRKRRKSKKSIDDGNTADYQTRLKLWKEEKDISGALDDETFHDLDMGYKIPNGMWTKLYKYQQVGVQWLWELHQQRCGGILGDEMGLGKTIQIIAFLAGLAASPVTDRHLCYQGLGPVLIICPTTVMHQWVREFHAWWPPCRVSVLHESGSHAGTRPALIASLSSRAGVLVTSYSGAVQHRDDLVARDWHYVVLDEGHKIRNPDAQVTITCKMFRTPHRIILSGSPMQNHLKELWSLFDFIFPGKLGTLPVFLAQLAVPITQGGYANATEVQVATAYRCARMLRDTIDPYLLRRMKSDVQAHIQLPAKSEQVLFCRLTDEQRALYKSYIESPDVVSIIDGRMKVFVGLINLRKICNHPDIYSGGPKIMRWEKEEDFTEEQRYGFWRRAGKMLVIESLLKIWRRQGHRVLLFTQSRQMLCILEAFVQRRGYSYVKMDGGTSIGSRQPLVKKFNEDPSIFVFLLTTRVGGLGVNLTGADRVVIYDPDWNPATDLQARERAWRIGQLNNVTVYRLVTAGTIEEKIYHRQIFKQFLTNKVLRDPRQRRFFKTNDLFELFTLKEEEEGGSTETAAIFAGTNSEVKVNMNARSKYTVSPKKPKPSTSSVASTTAELRRMKKLAESVKAEKKAPDDGIQFSQSKVEHMKRLAQMLSQKLASSSETQEKTETQTKEEAKDDTTVISVEVNLTNKTTENSLLEVNKSDCIAETQLALISEGSKSYENKLSELQCNERTSKSSSSDLSLSVCNKVEANSSRNVKDKELPRERHRHRSKSKRKERGAKFEGERIPYLVKQREAKTDKQQAIEKSGTEDDYVLKRLFKKSGLHEALHHDVIVGEGEPDYALVEGEAKRVAREAVQALKESRKQCWQAESGVPSWTGQSGHLNRKPSQRFGKKAAPTAAKEAESTPSASQGSAAMSSQELIARMRERNRLTSKSEPSDSNHVSAEHSELLADIRNFLAFGAALDNSASTQEILDKFTDKLPLGMSPLFKCLLEQVAEFHRMGSGEGMWRLRAEFRW